VRLVPPGVGHYRATATFEGTRDAATSGTGWRPFAVEVPLPATSGTGWRPFAVEVPLPG
jgi:hypothetical protein